MAFARPATIAATVERRGFAAWCGLGHNLALIGCFAWRSGPADARL